MKATGMALATALLGASTSGWAMDTNGSFRAKGAGSYTCSAYLAFSEQEKKITETWWTGSSRR